MESAPRYLTAALYKFVDLPDHEAFCATRCWPAVNRNQVKGTLLLAGEGINGTIAGPEAGVRAVLAHLRADPRLADVCRTRNPGAITSPPFSPHEGAAEEGDRHPARAGAGPEQAPWAST